MVSLLIKICVLHVYLPYMKYHRVENELLTNLVGIPVAKRKPIPGTQVGSRLSLKHHPRTRITAPFPLRTPKSLNALHTFSIVQFIY